VRAAQSFLHCLAGNLMVNLRRAQRVETSTEAARSRSPKPESPCVTPRIPRLSSGCRLVRLGNCWGSLAELRGALLWGGLPMPKITTRAGWGYLCSKCLRPKVLRFHDGLW